MDHRPEGLDVRIFWTTLLGAGLLLGACSGGDAEPADSLREFVAAYNVHDLDGSMANFTDGSVMIDGGETYTGLDAIREEIKLALDRSADENAFELINIQTDGDRVVFGADFTTIEGECFRGTGHEVIVVNGNIDSWEWGPITGPCP